MAKRILLTEHMGPPRVHDLEEFIKAQTIDAAGSRIMPHDGGMYYLEIDSLRSLKVGESMSLGESEAGLTVERLSDSRG